VDENGPIPESLPAKARGFIAGMGRGKKKALITDPLLVGIEDDGKQQYWFFLPVSNPKHFPMEERLKIIASNALKKAVVLKLEQVAFLVEGEHTPAYASCLAEGALLGSYRFERYKKSNEDSSAVNSIVFLCDRRFHARIEDNIQKVQSICRSVNRCRDLVNEISTAKTPELLARYARNIAASFNNMKCTVYDEKRLKREGFGGLLTVGAGSVHPPRLIMLEYRPKVDRSAAHLCLVGKGITFDTGGLCLKPGKSMWEMKEDMAGAAAVMHAVEAVAAANLPVRVTAIMPAAENAIGSRSTLPGYVMKARNGKTVHIINTDAEGRLILSDALWLAAQIKPTHVIDIATLTGSCSVALGSSLAGLFGSEPEFNNTLIKIAGNVGEPCWPLPLHEEYREYLKSEIADLNNISSLTGAGAITAALFLDEFRPANIPWIHLDIAGTASTEKSWKYFRPGATGWGVRTFVSLAEMLAMQ